MTRKELQELVAEVQKHQCELDGIEVKSAARGTPQRLYESLSALANRPGGGVILFGLDEAGDFSAVGVGNTQRLQEEVGHLASSEMEPALRLGFTVGEADRKPIVAIEVPEVAPERRPCHYKPAGLQKGSYIRVGNTNRQMSDYEVFGYVSAHKQPDFDAEPVAEATLDDLDRKGIDAYLESLRRARRHASYLKLPREQVLSQLRIVRKVRGRLRPTLAGLLVFWKYPQTFVPQLVITFLQFYGATEEEKTPRGERFLDNRKFEGPIPEMAEDAIRYVMGSVRKR